MVEKLSNESFLAVVGNVIKDLVNDDQEDLNVLAVLGTIIEDLVNDTQEDMKKWFECSDGNVMISIAVTFRDEIFDQEDAIIMGNNDNADD
jgi:hypothetical protein